METSRIVYLDGYRGNANLASAIFDVHTDDGDDSPLTPEFLAENEIDLQVLKNKLIGVADMDDAHELAEGEAENYLSQSNLKFIPAWDMLTNGVQFLKGFYVKNPRNLVTWKVKVDRVNAIVYPKNFDGKVKLFNDVYNVHAGFVAPAVSPMAKYLTDNSINFLTHKNNINASVPLRASAEQRSGEKEKIRKDRDDDHKKYFKQLTQVCQFLKRHYSSNTQDLIRYSITVDSSPQAPVERTYKILPTLSKTIGDVKVGTNFTNNGTTVLLVNGGKTPTSTATAVQPGATLTTVRGMGTLTVRVAPTEPLNAGGSFKVFRT